MEVQSAKLIKKNQTIFTFKDIYNNLALSKLVSQDNFQNSFSLQWYRNNPT